MVAAAKCESQVNMSDIVYRVNSLLSVFFSAYALTLQEFFFLITFFKIMVLLKPKLVFFKSLSLKVSVVSVDSKAMEIRFCL